MRSFSPLRYSCTYIKRYQHTESQTKLLPVSPRKWKSYRRFADFMEHHHSPLQESIIHFAASCDRNLWGIYMDSTRENLMTTGITFCRQLQTQNQLEESRIFPYLAQRMPEFGPNSGFRRDHRRLNDSVAELRRYLRGCLRYEEKLNLNRLGLLIHRVRTVLHTHFEKELEAVSGHNMRKYWSLEEMENVMIPSDGLKVRSVPAPERYTSTSKVRYYVR
ncbi:hypothetical protein PHISCL_05847 [Aspergillus sclerotialis]|uniref:Hemerythrin-like domain-containing protein n=1 Tax=Aspergillus sclerotialis TaxID=2070753 RepID=A0A3A2ZF79_9EURO|nr:hypothetical protein PHISCL_05847 [Aspergillus sclerotialis]